MRRRSRYVPVLAAASLALAVPQPVGAVERAHENFGPSFPIYANGGRGFSGPWAQGGFNAFASGYVPGDDSLCYSKLQTSSGSVSGGAFPAINGAVRNLASPLGVDNTTVYVSFLIQPQGTLHEGVFRGFFGLTLNGSLGFDLFVGKPGGGADDQYVLEARGGAFQVASGTEAVVGRTTLMVLRADFRPGIDTFTLYTNPRLRDPEPSSGTVLAAMDLGVVSRIGIYSTGAFAIDEVRIGTAYADVVPASWSSRHHKSHGCDQDRHHGDKDDDDDD